MGRSSYLSIYISTYLTKKRKEAWPNGLTQYQHTKIQKTIQLHKLTTNKINPKKQNTLPTTYPTYPVCLIEYKNIETRHKIKPTLPTSKHTYTHNHNTHHLKSKNVPKNIYKNKKHLNLARPTGLAHNQGKNKQTRISKHSILTNQEKGWCPFIVIYLSTNITKYLKRAGPTVLTQTQHKKDKPVITKE